jgi:hypothetical protein
VYQTFDAVPVAVPTQSLRARSKYDIVPGPPGATLPALVRALVVVTAPALAEARVPVAAPALDAASGSIAPAVANVARILTTRLRPGAKRAISTSAGPPGPRADARHFVGESSRRIHRKGRLCQESQRAGPPLRGDMALQTRCRAWPDG